MRQTYGRTTEDTKASIDDMRRPWRDMHGFLASLTREFSWKKLISNTRLYASLSAEISWKKCVLPNLLPQAKLRISSNHRST